MFYGSLPAEFNIDVALIEILLVTNYIIFESNQIRLVGFSNGQKRIDYLYQFPVDILYTVH